MDVSFISSTLILPVLPPLLDKEADLLVLVKPQFEVGPGQVGKGGVVRDPQLHEEAIAKVARKSLNWGLKKRADGESALARSHWQPRIFLHAIWPKMSRMVFRQGVANNHLRSVHRSFRQLWQ